MKKSFTLIELLVVIVIIGVLATLATVAVNGARTRARDAKRISDLKQISTALEMYYADYTAYPNLITPGQPLTSQDGTKTYMAKVPNNPTPRAEGACANLEYQYKSNGDNYSLIGCLANSAGSASAGSRKFEKGGISRDYGPTNGLVAWWMMNDLYTSDNKILDSSGNGNDGIISGATLTNGILGEPNGAYNFNGTTQVITVPESVSLKPEEITVSLFFKINEWSPGLRQIFFTKWKVGLSR